MLSHAIALVEITQVGIDSPRLDVGYKNFYMFTPSCRRPGQPANEVAAQVTEGDSRCVLLLLFSDALAYSCRCNLQISTPQGAACYKNRILDRAEVEYLLCEAVRGSKVNGRQISPTSSSSRIREVREVEIV